MVRRICTNCRTTHNPSPEELEFLGREEAAEIKTFYTGTGCNLCTNTGYRGRIGIFELLVMSEEIRKMLRGRASAAEITAQATAEGMVTMKQDGILKVKDGITSISEVMRSVFAII